MDREKLEQQLNELPLYVYAYIDPKTLDFSDRIRYICKAECPMYGKTWACPPAVGQVSECKKRCESYTSCLLVGTITQVVGEPSMEQSLSTRPEHEKLTNQIRDFFREQGVEPYVLSTEACAACERCAYLDGLPCRLPDRMNPCLESHGINIIPTLEENGLDFIFGLDVITWYSLLFFNE